ncbi:MAG: hypothetical protein JSR28_02935 [Proteobacteria bacterium]|nr:hypothetical protein [Pseudomonadota bacterium]
MPNGLAQSFNARPRDECLDETRFPCPAHARSVLNHEGRTPLSRTSPSRSTARPRPGREAQSVRLMASSA